MAIRQGDAVKRQTQKSGYLSFRTRILLVVVLANLALTGIFTVYCYQARKASIIKDVDSRLLSSAYAIRHVLPEGFHATIRSAASVDPQVHAANVRMLSEFAKQARVTYLYTMVKTDDGIVFTSTSATDDELRRGSFDPFFTPYTGKAPKLEQAFVDHRVSFEESHDLYGDFRSVIVPVVMDSGRVYVMGADLDIGFAGAILAGVLTECLLMGSLLLIISISITAWILQRYSRSMTAVNQALERIVESRNLAGAMDALPDDETGEISRSVKDLQGLVCGMESRMKDASGTILRISRGIVSETAALASLAQDQYDVMDETSRDLEDLGGVIGRNIEQIVSLETELTSFYEAVQERIGLIPAMNESMQRIDESSSLIEQMVGAINEIAFQANLLTLNASMEAGRAGSQGSDFQVVAEELGNLAGKAREVSRELEQVVRRNQENTRNGTDLVMGAAEIFGEVIKRITGIKDKISDITRSSIEQGAGIEYMGQAVSKTRDVLERNTDLAGRIAESARELQSELDVIERMVSLRSD